MTDPALIKVINDFYAKNKWFCGVDDIEDLAGHVQKWMEGQEKPQLISREELREGLSGYVYISLDELVARIWSMLTRRKP